MLAIRKKRSEQVATWAQGQWGHGDSRDSLFFPHTHARVHIKSRLALVIRPLTVHTHQRPLFGEPF